MQIFNYCQNCSPIWTIAISWLNNFDFCGPWFFYSSAGLVYQHFVNNGTLVSSLQTNYGNPQIKPIEINGFCLTNIFSLYQGNMLRTIIDNTTGTFTPNMTATFVDFSNYTSLIISNSTNLNNNTANTGNTGNTNNLINPTTTNPTIIPYINFNASGYEIILTIVSVVNCFRMRDFSKIYFMIN